MNKILLSTICLGSLLTGGFSVTAQTQEFSMYAGGGISGLQYNVTNGANVLKPGFQTGFGYTRFLTPHWGILSGLELGYYHTRATLNSNAAFTSNLVDNVNDGFKYQVKANGYKEEQKLYTVNIPLLLQYQTPVQRGLQFFGATGFKLSVPFSCRYNASADQISAAGYYPNLNIEIKDLPAHGFGTQNDWTTKGNNDFKLSGALSAEAGLRFHIKSLNYLYASAYIDYGLNNIKKGEGATPLLTYNPIGLTQSQATGIFSLAGTTGNVRLMAYGIKLRIGFGCQKVKKAVPVENKANALAASPVIPLTPPVKQATVIVPKDTAEDPIVATAMQQVAEPTSKNEKIQDTLSVAEERLLKKPVPFRQMGDTLLSPATRLQLEKIVVLLQTHPDIVLEIQGYTCDIGTDAANKRIGLARAKAVVNYLEHHGISANRIHALSKGDTEPLVPNTSEANRRQNRRVMFITTEK